MPLREKGMNMVKREIGLVYAHDGKSVYDQFFLKYLTKRFKVYLLTFNREVKYSARGVQIIRIRDLFKPLPVHDGVRVLSNALFRAYFFNKYIRSMKPSLLIGCTAFSYGFYSAFSKYKPFMLFIWGSDVLVYPKYLPFRFLAKYAIKEADTIVLDSEVQKRAAIRLGADPNRIIKFPWVDLEMFYKDKSSRNEIRDKLGWRDNVVVVSTRWLEPRYGVESLINAVPKIVKKAENVRFLIIGDGKLNRPLKIRIKKLKVEKFVKFLGRVEHETIPNHLKAADIYVSTSFSDGSSASLLEAMACKLPPVVTTIPGNQEWVSKNENGMLFTPGNSEELANYIISLVRNEELREKLGENAYLTVRKKANWSEYQKILDESIYKLINQP